MCVDGFGLVIDEAHLHVPHRTNSPTQAFPMYDCELWHTDTRYLGSKVSHWTHVPKHRPKFYQVHGGKPEPEPEPEPHLAG